MKAIILSAGQGKRLLPLTEALPKCLLTVDNQPILKWQLETLSYFKFENIIVVGGFMKEKLQKYLRHNYPNVTFIWNTQHAISDNIYSLKLALDRINSDEPVLILNGDTIFHKEIPKLMIASEYRNCVGIIKKVCNAEDMKVICESAKRIEKLSKEINLNDDICGQALGIYKISDIKLLKKHIANCSTKVYFNQAIHNMAQEIPLYCVDITNYPSMEIDTKEDLDEANDMFKWEFPEWEYGIRHGSSLNENLALNLLKDYREVFNKYDIPFFFIFGLALGAYRDKKFIPWDTDLDIGCYLEDRDKVLLAEKDLLAKGCYIPQQTNFYYDRWCIRDKEKIELHFFEKIGDQRVYDIFRCNFRYPATMLENLNDIDFYGEKFKIPSQTEEFLRLSYGESWQTPIQNEKTIQIKTQTKTKDIYNKILICGDFNPITLADIDIITNLAPKGEIIILVHTDRYLVEKNKFPVMTNVDDRRQFLRHLKNVNEVYIANDATQVICEDLGKYMPDIYIAMNFQYTDYEKEVCNKMNIKYFTQIDYQNFIKKEEYV